MTKFTQTKEFKLVFSDFPSFLAFGFGSGLAPKAPGTFGTLAAVPFLFLLEPWLRSPWFLLFIFATFLIGIYLCGHSSRKLNVHDHGGIVWDEFVGLWLTFWMVPLTATTIIAGFVLFRLFDILKPFPISWLDKKVHGGLGIMLDDLLAGLFALISMHFLMDLLI